MNPFYFGTSGSSLFGIYNPPAARLVKSTGVVLCYPFGQEYMRAHRAFRQLAMLLTRAGFHVFRFDYFGTGDSAGDSSEGTIETWADNVAMAIDELRDTADLQSVSVVGLRLGGLLGALASSRRTDVESLVLWDPIVNGRAYAKALIDEGLWHESYRADRMPARTDGTVGVLGFPLTAALRAELESADLTQVALNPRTKTLIVVSQDQDDYRSLERKLRERGTKVEYSCIPMDGNWNEVDANGSALIPQAVIKGIVGYLSGESR